MSSYTNNTAENRALLQELLPQGSPVLSGTALSYYMSAAEEAVLKRAFAVVSAPSDEQREAVLRANLHIQIRIALALIAKEGVWGETDHSENGVSRKYDSSDVPKALLDQITPYARMVFTL